MSSFKSIRNYLENNIVNVTLIIVFIEIISSACISLEVFDVNKWITTINICKISGLLMIIIAIYKMFNNILDVICKNDKKWNDLFYLNDKEVQKAMDVYNDEKKSKSSKPVMKSVIRVRCRFYKWMYVSLATTGIGSIFFDKIGNIDLLIIEMIYPVFIIIAVFCGKLVRQMYIDFVLLDAMNSECNE